MSFHTCWDVKSADGKEAMPLDDVLARLAGAFPVHQFDPEGARQNALRRLAALEAIKTVPMPEEILAYYRDAYPVDVVLADGDDPEAVLKFSIWPAKDRTVNRIQVYFMTEERQRAAGYLLSRMADCL